MNRAGMESKKVQDILLLSQMTETGIPEDIDLENSDTLGLQLVSILVDQLDGEIELKREKGNEFIIENQSAAKFSKTSGWQGRNGGIGYLIL
jgi:two-component sensor histidine kinase